MFRYLAPILIVVMVLVLVVCVAVILIGGLAERMTADSVLRLTAFDGIAAVGGAPPRIRAQIDGSKPGRPVSPPWLVVRFEDGWSASAWIDPKGLSRTRGRADLTAGPHAFTVALPELHVRLDVGAGGTVWVWPAEESVIWFGAGAIVPTSDGAAAAAPGPPSDEVRDIVDAVKTLASGRLPVYLVAADARGYASARRRLKAYGAPPGPAFWVVPGRERSRLAGLKGVWPRVHAAVVCDPTMRQAAASLKVTVRQVPSAGALPGAAETRNAWRNVLERLTARQASDVGDGR